MKLVIVTISVSGRSALIRPIAVMPSMFGMRRSMRMTSGSSRRAMATPSLPSAASPTTSMSSWRSKKTRSPIRTTAWSSTIRTRIRVFSSTTPPPGPGRTAMRRLTGPAIESSKVGSSSCLGDGRSGRGDDPVDELVRAKGLLDVTVRVSGSEPARCVGPVENEDAHPWHGLVQAVDDRPAPFHRWGARIKDDDVGSHGDGDGNRVIWSAGSADHRALPVDAQKAGEGLANAIVRIDDKDPERGRLERGGIGHGLQCRLAGNRPTP